MAWKRSAFIVALLWNLFPVSKLKHFFGCKRLHLETNFGAPRLFEFPAECPNIFFSFTSTWRTMIIMIWNDNRNNIKIIRKKKKNDRISFSHLHQPEAKSNCRSRHLLCKELRITHGKMAKSSSSNHNQNETDHKGFLCQGVENGKGECCRYWCGLLIPPWWKTIINMLIFMMMRVFVRLTILMMGMGIGVMTIIIIIIVTFYNDQGTIGPL